MLKNLLLLTAIAGLVALGGCGKKEKKEAGFSCKTVCEMNKKCVDALVKIALERIPEKFRDKAKEGVERGVRRGIAGERCVRRCERQMAKNEDDKKAAAACLKKTDCDEYAKCISEVVMKGRRGRRHRRGMRRSMGEEMKPE